MMFSKPALVFLAVLSVSSSLAQQQQQQQQLQRHEVLEKKDLTDLLDADLDEPFLKQPRFLQEDTASPTSAPTPSPAADGERGFETFSPTPSSAMRDLPTEAPVTSGASSWRSSAGVASAVVFVGSVAAAAVMA